MSLHEDLHEELKAKGYDKTEPLYHEYCQLKSQLKIARDRLAGAYAEAQDAVAEAEKARQDLKRATLPGGAVLKVTDLIGQTLRAWDVIDDTHHRLWTNKGAFALQSHGDCCAHAFMTDLELPTLPAKILHVEEVPGESEEDVPDCVRDTMFLKMTLSTGYLNVTLHTDHNGYYGGWLELTRARLGR